MNRRPRFELFVRTWLFPLLLVMPLSALDAEEPTDEQIQANLEKAVENLTKQSCVLQYKYEKGEQITYTTEHLVTIDTTISGNNQKTQLKTKSQRTFRIEEVTAEGNILFEHVVDEIDMWSEVSGRQPVQYNSRVDKEVPPQYQHVAESVGVPISRITMSPQGEIVDRDDKVQHPNLGLGGLAIPFPKEEISVGHRWSQPLDVRVMTEDNRYKVIKTRELYELKKIETGVATISVQTQVLTPINDPRVKSSLLQRISAGTIRFDIDAGRLISKQLDWDEQVLGFNGAESNMKYLARFTEELADPARTASK